jgi:hypothetical protein
VSKIREEAKVVLSHHYGVLDTTQARRVLLLEKAYRYQRAAWALMNMGIQMQGDIRRTRFVSRSLLYCLKAGEIRRQAEKL